MKPMQLAGYLQEIVARHTNSSAVWSREPVTKEQFAAIASDLAYFSLEKAVEFTDAEMRRFSNEQAH